MMVEKICSSCDRHPYGSIRVVRKTIQIAYSISSGKTRFCWEYHFEAYRHISDYVVGRVIVLLCGIREHKKRRGLTSGKLSRFVSGEDLQGSRDLLKNECDPGHRTDSATHMMEGWGASMASLGACRKPKWPLDMSVLTNNIRVSMMYFAGF